MAGNSVAPAGLAWLEGLRKGPVGSGASYLDSDWELDLRV